MYFTDKMRIEGIRLTKDGYLIAEGLAAKGGNVQTYSGAEVGRPELDSVAVYRPEEEVFSADSLASYAFKPITITHPQRMVSSDTWKTVAVGTLSGDVVRDGGFVRVPMMLMDAKAISTVRDDEIREISMGYDCRIEFVDGVTEDGIAYGAVQRDIRINHAAIVPRGRAGPECKIGLGDDGVPTPNTDPSTGGQNMADTIPLKAVMLDGLEIQTTTQGAQAIERLQRQLADATALVTARDVAVDALKAEHVAAIAAKDAEIVAAKDSVKSAVETVEGKMAALVSDHAAALAAKEGEVAALKDSIPDATKLDALIAARAGVIDAARKILGDGFDPKGKSDADIRRAAVVKRLGDAMVAGKSDEFVGAAFDTLSAVTAPPAGRDPLRDALRSSQSVVDGAGRSASVSAHDAYVEHLRNAWKGPANKDAA